MSAGVEEWAAQLSVKLDPATGKKELMWNFRDRDVSSVVGSLAEAAAFSATVATDVAQLLAAATVGEAFPAAVPITAPAAGSPARAAASANRPPVRSNDVPCPVNPTAQHYRKTDVGKNGKPYSAVFCNNTPRCAAVFD